MHIKPVDRSIKQLLEADFYRIPRFQRPYSWDKENVDDLWSDVVENAAPDYFIGSFVLYREKQGSDTYMVVDGQQRLTTLTLLFAALRNAFNDLKRTALVNAIQKLIERDDINGDRHYVLQTETSYPYLQEHIQKLGAPELPYIGSTEEDALRLAFEHLTSKVNSIVSAVDLDASVPASKKAKVKEKRLLKVRDNALGLQLILVELTNEDDAYLIFETLNTRGKDLGIADLVKNHLTRSLKASNKGVDAAKDKWNSVRTLFDASVEDIDINAFIYHSWLSRYPYVGREKLYKQLKGRVTKSSAVHFLDDLVDDAKLYRRLLEPSAAEWKNEEGSLHASVEALNIFRVVQPLPMTMAILRSYYAKQLSLAQTSKILREMENFHVQFTAVTAQRTGGGTARMYASSAGELTNASSKDKGAIVLKDFRQKMRERIPSVAEFQASFMEIEFHSGNTKQKGLVQYLLRRLHEHIWAGAPMDYAKMTIEHIASQTPPAQAAEVTYVGRLGNLLLLPANENQDVGNAPFSDKLVAYKKCAGVVVDDLLTQATTWGDKEIKARSTWLATLAYNHVFRV